MHVLFVYVFFMFPSSFVIENEKKKRQNLFGLHDVHHTNFDVDVSTYRHFFSNYSQYPKHMNVPKENKSRSSSIFSGKSNFSFGFRCAGGQLINSPSSSPPPDAPRVYLYEGMLGKER